MTDKYEGQKIFFFGDSITADGRYLLYLRAYFQERGINVSLVNKGISGYRADLLPLALKEELSGEVPDYAVLTYGANDLGVWLYDVRRIENEELLKRRKERIETFFKATEKNARFLTEKGIKVILFSPFCVNENLKEKNDIVSVIDNKEKEDVLDEGFYKKETFRRINLGLRELRDGVKKLAEKLSLEFWDLYSYTMYSMNGEDFNDDGTHYNEKGHRKIARALAEKMTGESGLTAIPNEEIMREKETESDERLYFFVKYNLKYFEVGRLLSDEEFSDYLIKKTEENPENTTYRRCLRYLRKKHRDFGAK